MNSNIKLIICPSLLLVLVFSGSVLLAPSTTAFPVTTHFARPRDLRAIWLLRDSTTTCPRNITHTAWSTPEEGTYALRHETIVQDGERCISPTRAHKLIFHARSAYNDVLEPITGPKLPEETLRQLRGDTVARRALEAGDRAEEEYLLGYEARVRQCGGGLASFEDGTVVFVYRPFTDKLRMEGVDEKLGKGLKWMVIAPREGGLCVYSSDVNGPDDGGKLGNGDGNGNSDDDSGGDMECFPRDAQVLTKTRGVVNIADVAVGEYVEDGRGAWTRVIGFSHRDEFVTTKMIQIETSSRECIRASQGHYLYTLRGLTVTGDVKVGDFVRIANGTMRRVSAITSVTGTGLVNVQTMSGDVVVDGVWASTYTTAVRKEVAHAALTPLRLLARLLERDFVLSAVEGADLRWVAGSRYIQNLSPSQL